MQRPRNFRQGHRAHGTPGKDAETTELQAGCRGQGRVRAKEATDNEDWKPRANAGPLAATPVQERGDPRDWRGWPSGDATERKEEEEECFENGGKKCHYLYGSKVAHASLQTFWPLFAMKNRLALLSER